MADINTIIIITIDFPVYASLQKIILEKIFLRYKKYVTCLLSAKEDAKIEQSVGLVDSYPHIVISSALWQWTATGILALL